MSEEKEILVTKTNSSLDKYIVEKDTRFDVVNSEQIIKRLQEENKKLKEVTNEAKIEYENLLINRNEFAERANKLEQENEELKKYQYKQEYLQGEIEKRQQALEEIREITDEYITDCMGSKCEGMEEIQNKINEVLNENS